MAAFAYYQSNKYDEAIIALDRFIQLHPGHKDIPYAYYLKALCYYEQISDIGRDQRITQQALDALAEVVKRFPKSPYARDARLKVELAIDHLAGKEMAVGRYYQQNQQYIGAINRYRVVIERYQTTTHVPEALHRLVESYLSLGVKSEAQEAAAVLGYNFPGSDWYQDSYYLMTGEGTPCAGPTRSAGSSASSDRTCMLVSLSIRDFVLIEKLDLNFSRSSAAGRGGLGALTGETGAGKSILIDALGLALGARAESGAVRRGAAQASVAASFDLPKDHPARAVLAEQALDDEDALTLRRLRRRRRPRPRLRQRSAGVGGAAAPAGRHAGRDPGTDGAARPAWTWRPIAPRSMPLPGWRSRAKRCAPPGTPGAPPSRRTPTPKRRPPPRGATRISCATR